MNLVRFCFLLVVIIGPSAVASGSGPEATIDFSRDVLPILSNNCFQCHGPDANARQAELRLDVRDIALRTENPIIVPGKSDDSALIQRITSSDPDEKMPPPTSNRKLSAAQVELLRRWVDGGAKWGKHWAYEPIRRPAVSLDDVSETLKSGPQSLRTPIDVFVGKRLLSEGLAPSPEAPRETLIRRLSLDLNGLPPTPAEVHEFVSDLGPDALDRLIDRLLAAPQFGERMVWEWLDAARYADSNGYQGDSERTMWPWRDWAIKAFNDGMPFDQFTICQLAGDLLPSASLDQKLATGFCRNHMINGEGGRIPAENRVDYVMDMAETTATVWQGLTLNCCRCHDHKFDPLTQRDYYQFFAFFNNTPVDGGGGDPQSRPVVEVATAEQTRQLEQLATRIKDQAAALSQAEQQKFPRDSGQSAAESPAAKELPDPLREILKQPVENRNPSQLEQLAKHFRETDASYAQRLDEQRSALEARDATNRSIPRVMVMEDLPQPRETFTLLKGIYDKPLEKVGTAVPASLPQLPDGAPTNRLSLARWLVSGDNPLTARVIVNRYWQEFFGIGLVKTTEDFGVQGEKPSHPELLDYLAAEFAGLPSVANGAGPPETAAWDIKRLCRRIVSSATYGQSSRVPAALLERDPENRLLARGPRFRMPSWMLRDQALAASGLLVRTIGGAPVKPYQPSGIWEDATFGTKQYRPDGRDKLYRRSVYTFWRRIVGPTMFFDTAARQTCTVKVFRTNSPLHALATLNDVTYVEASRELAQRVLQSDRSSAADRIDLAFRLVLARGPTADEARTLESAIKRLQNQFAADPAAADKLLRVGESKRDERINAIEHAAYMALASALLNLDESLNKE